MIQDLTISYACNGIETTLTTKDGHYDNMPYNLADMVKKACNVFCYTGCPHKTDSYNCLNDKCDTWKIFKRMMEEEL